MHKIITQRKYSNINFVIRTLEEGKLTVSFSNLVFRVAKPTVVLSGVFKEGRDQIKNTLESNGYRVRDNLLLGGQKVS